MSDLLDIPGRSGAAGASPRRIRSIAIVGGGTAGWLAAAMLARALPGTRTVITVIESPDIGTVGVGEATIPPIIELLRFLSIDEADFMRHTQATYKLGIKFTDWRHLDHSYWHPFGTFGAPINRRPFFHGWQRAKAAGLSPRFNDFSACAALGDAGKFRHPDPDPGSPAAGLRYALHFDATLVALYLRTYAERLGVMRLERTVAGATQRADGFLDELRFADGASLKADLYIDCSGFRGALIERILHTGYIDWSAMLPCDRAVAFPSAVTGARPPYTQSRARAAGWQWRIPLQHRCGNGYVYSSAHLSDEEARADLLAVVGDTPLAEPRLLRFTTGRRRHYWNRNCIALGLASGFLEPLESTSIHLVTSGVYHLLEHFPDADFDASNIAAYNAALIEESERVRDFIVLHYSLSQRTDTAFWRYCRAMALPDTLSQRIDLYRHTGRIRCRAGELFTDLSWFYIFEGLGIQPRGYDPLLDVVPLPALRELLGSLAQATSLITRDAPSHDSYFRDSAAPSGAVAAAAPR
ncbi:MAG TPA: tryptophan halogenase family protein [Steroidobacteraceae bacterium]|nr:tryptophan halogenase family protein [Steroidobacteraceae bacterium]